ncbi:MAG: hypothetical protein ACK2T4_04285 [Candidatus Promineifilaceae bacterium]|jgi:uncharacterized lipoprotein NlpE involved in copper resistance
MNHSLKGIIVVMALAAILVIIGCQGSSQQSEQAPAETSVISEATETAVATASPAPTATPAATATPTAATNHVY